MILRIREFLKSNFLIVFSGVLISQGIGFILMPILTKLTTQEYIGVYLYAMSLVNIFLVIGHLRMDMAIFQETNNESALKIIKMTFFWSFFIGSFLAVLLSLLASAGGWLFYFSIFAIVIFLSHQLLIESYFVNNGNFKDATINKIIQTAVMAFFVIIGGFFHGENITLYHALGFFIFFIFFITRNYKKIYSDKVSVGDVYYNIKKHKKFILVSTPASFINSLSIQLPIILIGIKYGSILVALYALMTRMVFGPINIVSSSFLTLFKQSASLEYRTNGNCRESFLKTMQRLSIIALILTLLMYFFAESFFMVFFGSEWVGAGEMVLIMLPMIFLKFIASPLTYIFFLTNRQGLDFVWQFILLIGTILIFCFNDSLKETLTIYSTFYSLMYIVSLIVTYSLSKGSK